MGDGKSKDGDMAAKRKADALRANLRRRKSGKAAGDAKDTKTDEKG